MSKKVTVFEVGPRDGLQNEKTVVNFSWKQKLIQGAVDAGVSEIELGAFVRPDKVPQMADTEKVVDAVRRGSLKLGKARGWCLVPNLKGLERAHESGVKNIAIFAAVTDGFSRSNIGMSVKDSLTQYADVVKQARKHGMKVRAYLSTVWGCPFDGKVPAKKALIVLDAFMKLDPDQFSLGDTIGVATPGEVSDVVRPAFRKLGVKKLAVHFHDTRGTALANTLRALDHGVRIVDSSLGGLGGCPYAPGASGNLATEDLVYMLDGMGMDTGINLEKLCKVSASFSRAHSRPLASKYLMAYLKS